MKTYVIAEIGINGNGSLDLTKLLIEKAHKAGCDAIKLQKRTIDLVYTQDELKALRESPWGTTFREQKEGLEYSLDEYKIIEDLCKSKGLDFIVSCWDLNAVDEIEANCNVSYHKVASALLTDKKFLERLNGTGKPIILSTGMSNENEIKKAVEVLDNVAYILACTSAYPTKDEEVNLNYILTLKQNFPGIKIGFSNHSSGLMASFGAAALGAECIEFHITLDRTMYGSDQAASIENVADLVSGIRKMNILLGDGIKEVYDSEKAIAKKLRKNNDFL